MNLEITVKNYRCFGDEVPAKLRLVRGITALIGGNNAGKSTLLRLFYEFRPLFTRLASGGEACANLIDKGLELPPLQAVSDRTQIFHRNNHGDLVIGIRILHPSPNGHNGDSGPDDIFIVISRKDFHCRANLSHEYQNRRPRLDDPTFLEKWRTVFESLSKTLYIGPFRGLDELSLYGRSFDLQMGGPFLEQVRELQKSGKDLDRVCDEIKALFRLKSFEIVPGKGGKTLEFLVNHAPTPIEELGSGLAQVVFILLHARLRRPDYIFIDEPEAHLHVSLQADFVTALSGFARIGLIFASHNLGLAKSAGERIYSVMRNPEQTYTTVTEFKPEQRLSEVLGELNFAAQQQQGCTKLLLVEGPTEIKAIRQILRKIKAENAVILLPLGGGSMITANRDDELAEIKKICRDVYALIDSEKPSAQAPVANDRLAFGHSCQRADIGCHVLERRSFENYFSEKAVQHLYGKKYRALGAFEDVKERYPAWQKADNWKIVRDMALEDIERTDLGRFLRHVVEAPCRV